MAVALLTAGMMTTACSNDDVAIENPTEQTSKGDMLFTATIAPKDGTTRSVSEGGVTTWVVNEQIAVYYQKTDDSYATATANVDAVNEGKATISATLSDAKNGGTVKFVYPASLVDATGDDIDETKLKSNQHGTIADISANFDAATASAILKTNGTTCGTTETIAFTNQVLIGKFTPKLGNTAIDGITSLTISDGSTYSYNVTPTSGTFGTEGIYVAMLPVNDKEVIISAQTASQSYGYGGKKITLTKGKLYNNLAIPMLKVHDLSSGSFNANEDAFIYQSDIMDPSNTITISAGHKVILSNVNISTDDNNAIACSGNADIILSGSSIVKNNSVNKAVIKAGPAATTLTISGAGSIDAQAIYSSPTINAAVIGSDGSDESAADVTCGNITITGGIIWASFANSSYGAAIGTGLNGICGTINITGGTINAYRNTSDATTYDIGKGNGGTTGTVTIAASVQTSDGKHYTSGDAAHGYNKK